MHMCRRMRVGTNRCTRSLICEFCWPAFVEVGLVAHKARTGACRRAERVTIRRSHPDIYIYIYIYTHIVRVYIHIYVYIYIYIYMYIH